ncbi:ComEC/Rec2 family competence protein [Isosphaeraceae bacterium EP7]
MSQPEASTNRPPWPPLAPATLALIAGIALDRFADPLGTAGWAVIALACGLIVPRLDRRRPRLAWVLALAACLALGGGWHHHRWSDRATDDLSVSLGPTPRPAWVRGLILERQGFRPPDAGSRPDDRGSTRLVLELSEVHDRGSWQPASGRALVNAQGDRSDLDAGSLVAAAGSLSTITPPRNPGEFDYRGYLRGQGIRLRLDAGAAAVWPDPDATAPATWPGEAWGRRWLGRTRTWSDALLTRGLDPSAAPLASALLLGRRGAIDPEVSDAFARTGTTHLLAISGLHLQVLALALGYGLRLLGVGRRRTWAAVALAALAYGVLVGLAPSVLRSAAMVVTACLAACTDRKGAAAGILAVAALMTLAWNPSDLFDIGCQLSFLAVAAILWLVPRAIAAADSLARRPWRIPVLGRTIGGPLKPLDRLERFYEPAWKRLMRLLARSAWEGVALSTIVWLAALPLVALRFHIVSPIGIALNIPLIPLTSLALLAAGLTLGLSALWMPLGVPAGWACGLMLRATEAIVRWGESVPGGHWFTPGPAWWWALAAYLMLGLAMLARGRMLRPAWMALAAWGALGLASTWFPPRPVTPEIEVLAVDHGLSIILQAEDGRCLVYDCGRMGQPTVGRRVIAPALWDRGVSRIEAVFLSHADSDHYNGLPDLMDRFEIGEVVVPVGFDSGGAPEVSALLDSVRARGIPVRECSSGASVNLGSMALDAVHPPVGWPESSRDNDRSLALEVRLGGLRLLLTGDLEGPGLTELARNAAPGYDALVAPHHGGRTANPPWFYDWARPAVVLVSQREPAPGAADALSILDGRGIPLWRTWQRGALRVRPAATMATRSGSGGLAVDGWLERGGTGPDP